MIKLGVFGGIDHRWFSPAIRSMVQVRYTRLQHRANSRGYASNLTNKPEHDLAPQFQMTGGVND